jgi:hypothetical protein
MELFITLGENKPVLCQSKFPDFCTYLLKAAFDFMKEITISDDWPNVISADEEDDESELYKCGYEVIDRALRHFNMDVIGRNYFQAIGIYIQQEEWQSRCAALTAISEGVEFVEDSDHIAEVMQLCLLHTG